MTKKKKLGVVVSASLSRKQHAASITVRTSQCIYFMCLIKRAGASVKDGLALYKESVRSCLEYACAVWHTSLTHKQSDMTQSVQKLLLRGVYLLAFYPEALALSGWRPLCSAGDPC